MRGAVAPRAFVLQHDIASAIALEQLNGHRRARDDPVEQTRQFIVAGGAHLLEDRFAPGAPIHAVEHQTVQMDVQVGGRAESMDERDRAGVGYGAFEPRLLEQKPRDDTVG